MSKLRICVAIAILMFLAGCGVRYNWYPQEGDGSRPPGVEYEGTGLPDPTSEL